MNLLHAQNSSRPAIIRGINPARISPDQEKYLLEFVNGTRELVCSTVSGPGRSLYVPPQGGNGLPGLKIKGAGGLKRKGRSDLEFYSPQPDALFSGPITHMGLNADLNFFSVNSRPRALNSLRAPSAEMEFRSQRRLSEHDIGFDGLCWGEFLGEVDLNGHTTGFDVSEYNLDYAPLSRVLAYEIDGNGLPVRRLQHDTLDTNGLDAHFDMVRRIGGIKRKMALDAELARHSSTLSNFLYSIDADRLLVTDTDTLADYREMEPSARGSQFLRDGVSDTVKRVEELQFASTSEKGPMIIRQVVINFLEGLLGDSVKKADIYTAVDELKIPHRFQEVARQLNASSRSSANISGWVYFGYMYPEMYRVFYRLLLKSDLPDAFPIQKIDPEILYQRARTFFLTNACL